jgi:hypothetical protein
MSEANRFTARIRRPFGLVLLAYALRSTTAIIVAFPLAQRLAPANVMALPLADRGLFAPGARVLAQTLAEQSARLSSLWHWGWLWGSAVLLASSLSTTLVLQGLACPPNTRVVVWLLKVREVLPTMLAITGLQWITFLALIALGRAVLPFVPSFVYPLFGEKGADVALMVIALVVATLALIALTISDLARAASILWASGVRASVSHAWLAFTNRSRLCLGGVLGYLAACCVLPICIEHLLPLTATATSLALVTIGLVHQLTVVALCALHLLWWLLSLTIVRAPQETKALHPVNSQD